jgi:hypothetical protein
VAARAGFRQLGPPHPRLLRGERRRRRSPQRELQLQRILFDDPLGKRRDGRFDVMLAWLPVDEPDLTVGPVMCTDRRVLAVPVDHELAARTSVSVETLADYRHAVGRRLPRS